MYLPAAAVYELCLAILLQLLAAAVPHRVPDGKSCCCGSLNLIPIFSYLFIQTRFVFSVPLGGTVAFTASLFT